jgi:hypothetical protein
MSWFNRKGSSTVSSGGPTIDGLNQTLFNYDSEKKNSDP